MGQKKMEYRLVLTLSACFVVLLLEWPVSGERIVTVVGFSEPCFRVNPNKEDIPNKVIH